MSVRDEVLPVPSIEQLRLLITAGNAGLVRRAHDAAKKILQAEFGDENELDDEEREEFDDELAKRTAKLDAFFSDNPHPEIEDW